MTVFGDGEMQAMLATAKTYTLMVLRAGANSASALQPVPA